MRHSRRPPRGPATGILLGRDSPPRPRASAQATLHQQAKRQGRPAHLSPAVAAGPVFATRPQSCDSAPPHWAACGATAGRQKYKQGEPPQHSSPSRQVSGALGVRPAPCPGHGIIHQRSTPALRSPARARARPTPELPRQASAQSLHRGGLLLAEGSGESSPPPREPAALAMLQGLEPLPAARPSLLQRSASHVAQSHPDRA
ncbi:hypothetical protein NDU88_005974 [Pleurodeles waltl]|uniref:Uncharacterized protein n=1 Tax=Pleurodeles waltl TaxID=8319 RepID=A0AAV7LQK6_PLEWA|nr:hypothetical protein NDU88_005974 [Pleurodeles waltl]